jgi:broad specificity phosphatase PhoE
MKTPLMYVVRHGTTTDSNLNIFRGQRDAALDKKGFLDAHTLKDLFARKEWHRIFCSPLTRAIQTATIICDDQSEYQPETTDGLEPWDIGIMTGQEKTEEKKAVMSWYVANPDEIPEGGESRRAFEQRVWPLMADGIQLGHKQGVPCIMVVHSSVCHALTHLLEGEDHSDCSVKPGGVIEVYLDNAEILHRAIFKKGTDDSSFHDKHHPTS